MNDDFINDGFDISSLAVLAIPLLLDVLRPLGLFKKVTLLDPLVSLTQIDIQLKRNSPITRVKRLAFLFCNLIVVCALCYRVTRDFISVFQFTLLLLCWTYATLYILFKSITTPPYRLLAFHSIEVIRCVFELFGQHRKTACYFYLVINAILVSIIFSMPLAVLYPSTTADWRRDKQVNPAFTSPEDNLTLFEYLGVFYMGNILRRSTEKILEENDTYKLSPLFLHQHVYDAVCSLTASSLLRKYLKANSLDLSIDISLQIFSQLIDFAGPLLLKAILERFDEASYNPATRRLIYLLVLVNFALKLVDRFVEYIQSWHKRRAYERTRGALMCTVVNKALQRKNILDTQPQAETEKTEEKSAASIGETVNLVFGDSYSVAQYFWDGIAPGISAWIEVPVAIIVLYSILGIATFSSLIVFLMFSILAYPLARLQLRINRKGLAAKDRRIAIVSEILECIRLLKSFSWEAPWLSKAHAARQKELSYVLQSNVVAALLNFLTLLTPGCMVLSAFYTYTIILGHTLTVPVAFSVISVYAMLIPSLNELPQSVLYILRTLVSVRRLERYLAEEELPTTERIGPDGASQTIHIEHAKFTWPSTSTSTDLSTFTLQIDDLDLSPKGLVLITGQSGSGKSCFLLSLLGETTLLSGAYERPTDSVAYCSQYPFLESQTIRDNILFHSPLDQQRYHAVLDACALRRDLEAFPEGDMSEIGERGVSLSGGQRMRVALARAIYSQARLVLLDDPLAALDIHTAQHVVQQAILGPLLTDRLVILATHQIAMVLIGSKQHYEIVEGKLMAIAQSPTLLENTELERKSPSLVSSEDTGQATLVASQDIAKSQPGQQKFMTEETTATGAIKYRVYTTYLKAAGYPIWLLLLVLLVVIRVLKFLENYVLKLWSEKPSSALGSLALHRSVKFWLLSYAAVVFASAIVSFARVIVGYVSSYRAASSLFSRCLTRVVSAPSRYFDTVPVGRILNRLVSDTGVVDSQLSNSIKTFLDTGLAFSSAFFIIVFLVPPFTIPAILLMAFYWTLARPYRETSRAFRRLENKHRSPLFSILGETVQGLSTIRAFQKTHLYGQKWFQFMDAFQGYDHFYWLAVFWLRIRFDFCGAAAVAILTIICVVSGLDAGWSAFAIVSAQTFVSSVHQMIWGIARLELDLSSVERIDELLRVEQECQVKIGKEQTLPPAYWPSSTGDILVENLEFRYAPHLPAVLKGITLRISPGQKLAIVGRSGSGKSTFALSLLRIAEAFSGSVFIDGLNTATVPLSVLRARISYTPQEPILFQGTIRENLDPLQDHSDSECFAVLKQVGLDKTELSQDIGSGGGTLSSGQRNLLALARALLRRANVFILDESTASLDVEMDAKVQDVIRNLDGVIVISIAHRLQTIIEFDSVVVMDNGAIMEHDSPLNLLEKENGYFARMARETGDFEGLFARAKRSASGSE